MFYDIDQIMNKEGHYVYSHCTDLWNSRFVHLELHFEPRLLPSFPYHKLWKEGDEGQGSGENLNQDWW